MFVCPEWAVLKEKTSNLMLNVTIVVQPYKACKRFDELPEDCVFHLTNSEVAQHNLYWKINSNTVVGLFHGLILNRKEFTSLYEVCPKGSITITL